MSTSGIYTLSKTCNQLATDAFDVLQIGADGETLSGDMISRFKLSANLTLKEWQAQAPHLWTETEGTLFLTVGQASYDFNSAATHVANTWYETTTTAATTAGAVSIAVASASNIQVGDVIGIVQNDNDLFWTTVPYAPSGLTVQLSDAITLATLSGAYVRNYRVGTSTSPDLKPISRMKEIRRKETSGYEVPIVNSSRKEYFGLPNKTTTGTPIQAYYSRQDVSGEEGGIMYLWNAPDSSLPVINFTYERKIQILQNGDDTVDIPEYALEAFIYECAVKLIPRFGTSADLAVWVKNEATRLKADVLGFDSTLTPIKVRIARG